MVDNQIGTETENLAFRVKKIMDSKKMTAYSLERAIGVTKNSINNLVQNKGGIGSDKIAKIITIFPEINSKWLLTGEGEMFLSDSLLEIINYPSHKPNVTLYNVDASAGGLIAAQPDSEAISQWFISELIGDHIAINVTGNSMTPTINEKDKIIAKECYRNDLRDGEIYIVVTTDNSVRVKRLRINSEIMMLWSDNIAYVPRYERLIADDIVRLFHVVMVCKNLAS